LKDKNPGRLATPLFVLRDDLGTAESWQTKALGASPLLTAADSRRRMAEQGVNAAKAAWHPQVYAFAQGNLIKHYLSLTEPDWVAGVGVKFTLWSNRDRMASLRSAEAVVAKADAAMSETRSQLAVGVETAWLRSVQARDQHKLTVSTLELAQENLKLRTKAFAEGLGTALDVSEARSKLLGAQIARKVAAYRFVVAWATLHAIAGDTEGFVDSAARSTNTIER
ncbi:MAG: TolC family protein, partial [Duodenibacillus sp.]|nr:TolC family protein [Duodenibacillus sp.]